MAPEERATPSGQEAEPFRARSTERGRGYLRCYLRRFTQRHSFERLEKRTTRAVHTAHDKGSGRDGLTSTSFRRGGRDPDRRDTPRSCLSVILPETSSQQMNITRHSSPFCCFVFLLFLFMVSCTLCWTPSPCVPAHTVPTKIHSPILSERLKSTRKCFVWGHTLVAPTLQRYSTNVVSG